MTFTFYKHKTLMQDGIWTIFLSTVFVQLVCAFRYGSEDLDVIGLCFRKDIWLQQYQLYPDGHKPALTPMHETLLKKAGDNAYPFSFTVCDLSLHLFIRCINKTNKQITYKCCFSLDPQQPAVLSLSAAWSWWQGEGDSWSYFDATGL